MCCSLLLVALVCSAGWFSPLPVVCCGRYSALPETWQWNVFIFVYADYYYCPSSGGTSCKMNHSCWMNGSFFVFFLWVFFFFSFVPPVLASGVGSCRKSFLSLFPPDLFVESARWTTMLTGKVILSCSHSIRGSCRVYNTNWEGHFYLFW